MDRNTVYSLRAHCAVTATRLLRRPHSLPVRGARRHYGAVNEAQGEIMLWTPQQPARSVCLNWLANGARFVSGGKIPLRGTGRNADAHCKEREDAPQSAFGTRPIPFRNREDARTMTHTARRLPKASLTTAASACASGCSCSCRPPPMLRSPQSLSNREPLARPP